MLIRDRIREGLQEAATSLVVGGIVPHFSVSYPPDEALGDYATNIAFSTSKIVGRPPRVVAGEIVQNMKQEYRDLFEKIDITDKGFINFTLSQSVLLKWRYDAPKSRSRVLIEYSSPNIGKPMGIGHFRSTIIGDALTRIFRYRGFHIITINHPGDWGKQMGLLIAALKDLSKEDRESNFSSVEQLAALYVQATARAKEDAAFNNHAMVETKKLQLGDRENVALWKKIEKVSKAEFMAMYKTLGIEKFDEWRGESAYQKELSKVVEEALQKGVAQKSEGAVVIHIEGQSVPLLIQKSDGSFLYGTTDLAAVKYRVSKYRPKRIIYVVGNEQTLHLSQVFDAARKLGYVDNSIELFHVKFGLLLGDDLKKFSTRAGKSISLRSLIDEAVTRARVIVEKKNSTLSSKEKDAVARAVGIGALKYFDLSRNRMGDVVFSWEHVLSLEENSAPYVQYTNARFRSILRKAPKIGRGDKEIRKEELSIIRLLHRFPEVLEDITNDYFPNRLTDYLFLLSTRLNAFYESTPVLQAEEPARSSRLRLVKSAVQVLESGLNLLGIEAPEKM